MKKAETTDLKLRMAICGPPKSGKTITSLIIATLLGGKVGLIDSERSSASKYAYLFNFDVEELDGKYAPQLYLRKIKEFEDKYDTLIIDSLSHAWFGVEGALDQADKAGARLKNRFSAWREVTPVHNALVDGILNAQCHVICTMRVKTDYVMEKDETTGKVVPREVGLAPVMREGIGFEFDIMADMDREHRLVVSGTRCIELDGFVAQKPAENLVDPIRRWLGITTPKGTYDANLLIPGYAGEKGPAIKKSRSVIQTVKEVVKDVVRNGSEPTPEADLEVSPTTSPDTQPVSWGDQTLACPEIAIMMGRLRKYVTNGIPHGTLDQFEEAYNHALYEICLHFDIGRVHNLEAEKAPEFEAFIKKEMSDKLRSAGLFPEKRTTS